MKIRQGFVSNSSSSSFLIVGKLIELPTREEIGENEQDYIWYEETPLPKGMKIGKDKDFIVLRPDSYDNVTIIGFGRLGSEYNWEKESFEQIEKWRVKANEYFEDIKSSIHFGIENPGH